MLSVKRKRNLCLLIFLVCIFVFILSWTLIQPFDSSPDERMRYEIVEYIVNYGRIPDGRDPKIRDATWGISYAFYPILSYMIMAVPAKIASFFTNSFTVILMAARSVNAVFGTVMAYLVFRLSERLFLDNAKYLFTALVVCLPGVIFVHSYVNNDSMALLSTAWISYVWVLSLEKGWTKKLCVSFALALSVCALSYYNAYGFILCSVIFFFTTIIIENSSGSKSKFIINRTMIVLTLVLVFASWWFIRNALLYNGDFLGMKTSNEYAELFAAEGNKPSQRENLGSNGYNAFSLLSYSQWGEGVWAVIVAKSFVGTFGYLNIYMPRWLNLAYLVFFMIGIAGLLTCINKTFGLFTKENGKRRLRKLAVLNWCMLLDMFITLSLLIYYNLYSDIQPQGRYLLPAVIPFMYFVTLGIKRILNLTVKRKNAESAAYLVLAVIFAVGAVYTYAAVFAPVYMNFS